MTQTIRTLAGLFPLTLQGTICLLVAAAALNIFAYGAMDLIVFALAICTLAIIIFCLFKHGVRRCLAAKEDSTPA